MWIKAMNKTIEEILASKPEARPRIYAYSIYYRSRAPAWECSTGRSGVLC